MRTSGDLFRWPMDSSMSPRDDEAALSGLPTVFVLLTLTALSGRLTALRGLLTALCGRLLSLFGRLTAL